MTLIDRLAGSDMSRTEAEAMLRRVLAAAGECGWVMVPKWPSELMQATGWDANPAPADTYATMLVAAATDFLNVSMLREGMCVSVWTYDGATERVATTAAPLIITGIDYDAYKITFLTSQRSPRKKQRRPMTPLCVSQTARDNIISEALAQRATLEGNKS